MKRIVLNLLAATIILTTAFVACKKDNNEDPNGNTEILKNAIFYQGTDFEEGLITYENAKGETLSIFACKTLVVVYFQDNINLEAATQIITQLNGTVIERIPAINYYVVKVNENAEANFIQAIQKKQETEFVYPYFICENYSYHTKIIDNGSTHASDVLSVYNECAPHYGQSRISNEDAGVTINGIRKVNPQKALNALITDEHFFTSDNKLVNFSFGPQAYKQFDSQTWQLDLLAIITQVKKMKECGKNIVITIAAGNNGNKSFENVIETFKTNYKIELGQVGLNILTNNILIVGAIDDRTNKNYSNQVSSPNNTFAMVNISNLDEKFGGTSVAAPRALCYIAQIIDEINLTPEQALAAVKEAVKENPNGVLDINEAKSIALFNYGVGAKYVGTWNYYRKIGVDVNDGTITLQKGGTATIISENYNHVSNGIWSLIEEPHELIIEFKGEIYQQQNSKYEYRYDLTFKANRYAFENGTKDILSGSTYQSNYYRDKNGGSWISMVPGTTWVSSELRRN